MDVACNVVCLHGPEPVLTIRMMGQAVAITKNGKEVKRPRILISISVRFCHVTNRGDGREPIFQDDGDRQRFVKTPSGGCLACRCHAGFIVESIR